MGFLYSQLFKSLPYPTGAYASKTVIITGSNVGLGKEAARHYARLGVRTLVLAVRNLDKGYAAKYQIEATTTGCADIRVWLLDMSSYDSVKKFSRRVEDELPRVDIFLANAGIAPAKFSTAEDNEAMITVNVVSTFLLAGLVLPKLKTTAAKFNTRSVLTITTSEVHGHTKFPQKSADDIFAAVNDKSTAEKNWDDQYPISKLLQIFAVRAIADKNPASKTAVIVNCVNPGLCHSELGREFDSWGFWLIKLLLARSTELGSRTLVHAGAQGAETHGQYLSDCKITDPAPVVLEGKETQDRVWKELVEKLEAIAPGVTRNF